MKAAHLTHGAFYNHFESKQAMVSGCVDRVLEDAVGRITTADPTVSGKSGFINQYLSHGARDNPGENCLMSSLGPEIAREPEIRPAMTRYIRGFINAVMLRFPWSGQATQRQDAIRLTASMVGALVLARAVDDEDFSDEILREVIKQYSNSKL
jgi:TetR/AcrR family transcriptional repressor of nem operon